MAKWKDITGEKFGFLSVISFSHVEGKKGAFFNCQCECGKTTVIRSKNLISGGTRSCGCLKKTCDSNKAKSMNAEHRKNSRLS